MGHNSRGGLGASTGHNACTKQRTAWKVLDTDENRAA